MLRDLIRHAGTLGSRVHFAPIEDDPTLLGYFLPEQRRIVVKIGLVLGQSRWVLGHECGHAYYGHRCNGTRADDANERQADAYASRLLIDPVEYARLEAINPDPHWLADEFSVDVECIFAFERHWLTRLTGVTYTRAQMGAGRWAHRVATA